MEGGFGPLFHLQASTAKLVRHADSRDAVRGLDVHVERAPGALRVRYELDADLGGLSIPPEGPMRPGERLWQHTCFEVFVSMRMPAYQEFNFSPSGEWAAYKFSRYRERVPCGESVTALRIDRLSGKLILEALVAIPSGDAKLGFSAVIESADGVLSYWALRHPEGKPDFHHPEAFAFDLDEVRN